MATTQALSAVGQAIVNFLAENRPPATFTTARFELFSPADFAKTTPLAEGVSLYLYRLEVNPALRNLVPPPRPDGQPARPALPLDLHYALTAWGATADTQLRLLGWALRTLANMPSWSSSLLNNYTPEANIFRPEETVELMFEMLTLQDLSYLWGMVKNCPPLSVGYLARVVLLETGQMLTVAPPVQTREFDYARR